MAIITPAQSQKARAELNHISQAQVAEETGLRRQYLSEFEGEVSQRFTTSQLRKLRAFYETKLAEARAAGETIDLEFGADDQTPISDRPAGTVETVKAKRFFFHVADEVPDETLSATLATLRANDRKLSDLLAMTAEREQVLFGEGDYTDDVLQAIRECYALLAANYLLVRAVGGWPEIGLSASGEKLTGNTVLAAIITNAQDQFAQAGLLVQAKGDEDEKEAA